MLPVLGKMGFEDNLSPTLEASEHNYELIVDSHLPVPI